MRRFPLCPVCKPCLAPAPLFLQIGADFQPYTKGYPCHVTNLCIQSTLVFLTIFLILKRNFLSFHSRCYGAWRNRYHSSFCQPQDNFCGTLQVVKKRSDIYSAMLHSSANGRTKNFFFKIKKIVRKTSVLWMHRFVT